MSKLALAEMMERLSVLLHTLVTLIAESMLALRIQVGVGKGHVSETNDDVKEKKKARRLALKLSL